MKLLLTILIVALSTQTTTFSQSWQRVEDSKRFQGRCDDMSFVDNYGWLVTSVTDTLYKSTDYGVTWENIGKFSGRLRSIEFLNKDIGLMGNLEAGLYRTTDGGMNWDTIPIEHPNFTGVCGIHFTEDSTFYATGTYYKSALIMKSEDLGLTWEITDLGEFSDGLVEVVFYDNNIGLLTGTNENGAVIFRTTDAGDSWDIVYESKVEDEWGWKIDFTDDGKFTFVSVESFNTDSTVIVKSSDKGITWTEIKHPYTSIQGISFWDEMNGIIGGWRLPIIETTDGGQSWVEIENTEDANINRIIRFDDYILASGNKLHKRTEKPTTILDNNIPIFKNLDIEVSSVDGAVELNIKASYNDQIVYSIYDINGSVIVSKQLEYLVVGDNMIKLPPTFKKGVYFINLLNVEGVYRGKFLVN